MHDAGSTYPSECEEEEAHRGDEGVVSRDEAEAAGGDLQGKDTEVRCRTGSSIQFKRPAHLVDALLREVLGGVTLQKNMCGIYLLVFPSGKGYIGQSRNIMQRWGHYSCLKTAKHNTPVEKAVVKYGWANVKKLVVCACAEEQLNYLEEVYMQKAGTKHPLGYNLKDAGNAGRHHVATRAKMKQTWAEKTEWTCKARKQQAIDGGRARIELDRDKVVRNRMTAASNSEAAKAKRKATWDRKREEKLAKMDPEKADKVRWQAVRDARRLQANGPPEGYSEYQAKRREEVREARRAEGWLG